MVKFQRSAVKTAARNTLDRSRDQARKLILIHTGAALVLTLLLSLIDYLLEQQIGATGGLSGISLRSTLTTVQSVLRYGMFLAVPAWNCGYLFAMLRLSRGEQVSPRTLLSGFGKFGAILRLTLLKAALYVGIGLLCINIASTIFMATPWAQPLIEALEPAVESGEITPEQLLAATEAVALPMILIFSGIFLAACIPVYYMLWAADFSIMDQEGNRALAALLGSFRLTRRNRKALLKLDLSYWWFFLLDLLVSLLCYGDLILTLLGIAPPWTGYVGYFLFLAFYAVAQLLLYSWKKNQIFLTYAHTYNALKEPTDLPTFPWNN